MAQTIDFYWDAASPYTYLAATQIDALAARCNATVRWLPFLIGKAFEATGNRPPVSVPAKGRYLGRDLSLWAQHYRVPFAFPKVFPVASLTALRIACALPEREVGAWARAAMTAYWANGVDIGQPDALAAILATLGHDASALLARTQDPSVKEQLRANTEGAIQRGAFGAPTFFVGETMFWGNDRLVLLEEFLQGRLAA
jgi:2-hydroxychromene-2-carboxylate isomerase